MNNPKVVVVNNGEASRLQSGQDRRSLLGWVRKKLRRMMKRKKKGQDIEIYPLF